MPDHSPVRVPDVALQVDFCKILSEMRRACLQDALLETVSGMTVAEIDRELAALVPDDALAGLAGRAIRGELLFPVPCVLSANPWLLAYYRMLLGLSRKAFYSSGTGLSAFREMEDKGEISDARRDRLEELCQALIEAGCHLLKGIGSASVTRMLLHELTLLTLGPQLRGSANVRIGRMGIASVFDAIDAIVAHAVVESGSGEMILRNAAERTVVIQFAADPDIIIREEIAPDSHRNIIAIEIKAGTDFSNVHNRIGEAEKSHQNARRQGYTECWTVINIDRLDKTKAKRESPSTDRFYRLSEVTSLKGPEFQDFRDRILSLTGLPSPRRRGSGQARRD
jgi:hypothetical protein